MFLVMIMLRMIPIDNPIAQVAHAAHLGGMIAASPG